ncbi:MAG: hypothetical protein ACK4SN_13065 [Bellilinea sp.]
MSLRASAASVAISRTAVAEGGWETPHFARGDINRIRHREPPQAAWRSPARRLGDPHLHC